MFFPIIQRIHTKEKNERSILMSNIYEEGARFDVCCARCGKKFTVIRNWGGGIRRADDENINPATCPKCGSRKLEVW
jgi:DNA-directed RNA polymerase subunit RPC12/RpoP